MPYTLTAKNIVAVNSLQFEVDQGKVIGMSLTVEVNYGEMGLSHQFDPWAELTDAQKSLSQAMYNRLHAIATLRFIESPV